VSRVGNDAEQDLRIGFRKAGGRFVKDQQTRLTNQAFANLDQLLLPDGHVAHDDVWVEMQVEFPENLCRLLLEPFPVHEGASCPRFHPQEDVLRDREVRREIQFVVNDGNSGRLRLRRIGAVKLMSANPMTRESGRCAPASGRSHFAFDASATG
jgi:hypothetical protein